MSFLESLVDDAKGFICETVEVQDKFFRAFELIPGVPPINAAAAALRDDASRLFCNREPPPLPPYPSPDNNCPLPYAIRVKFLEKADDGRSRTGENEIAVWGPILSYRYSNYTTEDVPQRFEVLAYGSTNLDRLTTPAYSILATGVYGNPAADKFVVDIIYVLPGSTNPNNCGVPLPVPPDYEPNADRSNRNITYIDASDNEITIPTEVTLGFAFNDNSNNISIPVTYTFSPNYSFQPDYRYNIDVVFKLDGSEPTVTPPYPTPPPSGQPGAPAPNGGNPNPYLPGNNPPPPPQQPPPGDEPPDPPPDVPEPEDPPIKNAYRIVGALVTSTAIETPTKISVLDQDTNPDVWFPDLGLISFLVNPIGSSYGWTEDIRIKNRRQFVACPWSGGAVEVKGTPRAEVTWTITPVYGKVNEQK